MVWLLQKLPTATPLCVCVCVCVCVPFFLGLVSNSYNNNLLQQQVQQFRQDVHSRSIPTVIAMMPVLRVISFRNDMCPFTRSCCTHCLTISCTKAA